MSVPLNQGKNEGNLLPLPGRPRTRLGTLGGDQTRDKAGDPEWGPWVGTRLGTLGVVEYLLSSGLGSLGNVVTEFTCARATFPIV